MATSDDDNQPAVRYRTVTFECDAGTLHLRLDAEWVRSPGMEPDVNTAIAPASEVELFKTLDGQIGTINFYFVNDEANGDDPDFSLVKIELISCEPGAWAVSTTKATDPATGREVDRRSAKPVEYVLGFADRRRKLVWPRGGFLESGDYNVEPLSEDGTTDANDRPTIGARDLAAKCFTAMGLDPADVPTSMDNTPGLHRNVEWKGAHAPTELAKILKFTGHALMVQADGDAVLRAIGVGDDVTPPPERLMASGAFGGVNVGGDVVVFTSSPDAQLNTETIQGVDDNDSTSATWEYVCRDQDSTWKALRKTKWFKDEDPLTALQNDFKNVDPAFRAKVKADTYRCIRLNRKRYGPAPIQRFTVDLVDPKDHSKGVFEYDEPSLMARSAQLGLDYMWRDPGDLVRLQTSTLLDYGTVISSPHLLLKLDPGVTASNPVPMYQELSSEELQIRCTREYGIQDSESGEWVPQFSYLGYTRGQDGTLTKMSDGDVKNARTNPDTVVIRNPLFRGIRVDGEVVNQKDLDDRAKSLAPHYLPEQLPVNRVLVTGYFDQDMDGRVSRIRYDQQKLLTTYELNGWRLATADLQRQWNEVDRPAAGEKYPGQTTRSADRIAEGAAGSAQPAVPIQPTIPDEPPPLRYATIVSKYNERSPGAIEAKPCDVNGIVTGSNTISLRVPADGLVWPGGIFAYLPTPGNNGAFGLDPDGNPTVGMVVSAPRYCFLMRVDLVKTGGSAGDANTLCSFVYSIFPGGPGHGTILSTNGSLADGLVPEMSPGRIFPMTCQPATKGMAYFAGTSWALAYAFEGPGVNTKC